mmetsp:Transcript_27328/g.41145  ORF Transcript_27328/g.41145 Transcript_27328/m.41145 type:complete len:115 (-) Transcript_27328:345-689(-)
MLPLPERDAGKPLQIPPEDPPTGLPLIHALRTLQIHKTKNRYSVSIQPMQCRVLLQNNCHIGPHKRGLLPSHEHGSGGNSELPAGRTDESSVEGIRRCFHCDDRRGHLFVVKGH